MGSTEGCQDSSHEETSWVYTLCNMVDLTDKALYELFGHLGLSERPTDEALQFLNFLLWYGEHSSWNINVYAKVYYGVGRSLEFGVGYREAKRPVQVHYFSEPGVKILVRRVAPPCRPSTFGIPGLGFGEP